VTKADAPKGGQGTSRTVRALRHVGHKAQIVGTSNARTRYEIPAGAEILAIDSVPDSVVDRQQQVHVRWEERREHSAPECLLLLTFA
jgi:hypothetical protein